MDAYCKEIRKLQGKFYGIEYSHVVRDKNKAANDLSKLGSSWAKVPHGVFVQDLVNPSIKEEEDHVVEKPPHQQLVATVPSPITTKSSPPHILHLWPLIIVTGGYPLSSTYRMERLY
jgi:hypothetical protein